MPPFKPLWILLYAIFIFQNPVVFSQSSILSLGNSISSSEGKMSYSIGQIGQGSYVSDDFSINEGVQQPFDFFVSSLVNDLSENFGIKVYPNPVRDRIKIEDLENPLLHSLFVVSDVSGKVIIKGKIGPDNHWITMHSLTPGLYILKIVTKEEQPINFQIIKI
jgi:hypothetical protein